MDYESNMFRVSLSRRFTGWLIHAFTASGAFVGLLALMAIHQQKPLVALWMMFITIAIDAVDGMFARMVQIKIAVPEVDGALLDNIVDFFNYTIVPAFFLLCVPIVPTHWCTYCVAAIVFSSAYQFTQVDAKTSDHFFKGFPSYWNIAVFYLFFWQMDLRVNGSILFVLSVLSFVPIKYVYPSRLDYLTKHNMLRIAMLFVTVMWGFATAGLLWVYPKSNPILVFISMSYLILYAVISLYRTFVPLVHQHKQAVHIHEPHIMHFLSRWRLRAKV